MTKAQLAARVKELESAHAPALPAHIAAHEAGAALREKGLAAGRATRRGVGVTAAVTKGFFAGLFGK